MTKAIIKSLQFSSKF